MKIIIVGAGMVGTSLAEYFSNQNHSIAIIEKDETRCESIENKLDVFVICANGASPKALEAAGISSADMLLAVTSNDETNLLACHFAMQQGVKKRIARIRSEIYSDSEAKYLEILGVTSVIETEKEVVNQIMQFIELPKVIETANFQSNNIYLRGYKITADMPIAGKTLSEIAECVKNHPMLVVVIIRDGHSVAPIGSQRILDGDEIMMIMPKDSFKEFLYLINGKTTKMKKIIVSGDSLTAIHLAQALSPMADSVLLVDPNREHADLAATMLNSVDVFYGDSTDSEVLQEINVAYADCFIAAGNDLEDNVMACLLSKSSGAKMVMAVRNDDRYSSLFNELGIDHIINPYEITLNMIIDKIHMAPLGAHLKLMMAEIEVMRLNVEQNSFVFGKALKDLNIFNLKGVVIGAIIRNNKILIPSGTTTFNEKDEVLVLSKRENVKWVNKQFNSKFNFFK